MLRASPLRIAAAFAALLAGLAAAATAGAAAPAASALYNNSYAVVIGVSRYPSAQWPDLSYARKDAEGMAALLEHQGFTVTALYDEAATARRIQTVLEDGIAPKLAANDRVLIFFSGHGHTQTLGSQDYGYLVPFDADGSAASLISMDWLRSLSDRMNAAKHQAFIIDACFGGQLAPTKAGLSGIAATHPNYIAEIARRPARQFITAGGKDQQVLDGGPGGYSYFTGYLLEALDGDGDLNGDGYITMNELTTYLVPRATNAYQTPGAGQLPGHGLGEFVFASPSAQVAAARMPAAPDTRLGLKGGTADDERAAPVETAARPPEPAPIPAAPAAIPSADRATVERLLAGNRDDLRRKLTDFMRISGNATDASFDVQSIWKAQLVDAARDGFIVSIHYEALVSWASRTFESRTRRFRMRLDGDRLNFVELLPDSG